MSRKRNRKRREDELQVSKLEALKQINLDAAGLDIGDAEIYVAVPEGRDSVSVRVFQTFTRDLYALADWLTTCGVKTVAMESTGVYWIPIYEILEKRGFKVYLVNARHVKNVPGRKTDILDCQWIQQLHTYGLLRASFRPPEDICALRALVRHRDTMIRSSVAEVQRMQKALQQMNVKLTNVLSDITGVTGMSIIRDILAGERDSHKLAAHRDFRCKKSQDEIAKSLEGNYKPEHIFVLKQSLQARDFYQNQIKVCDVEIKEKYTAFEPKIDASEHPLIPGKHAKPRGNEPDFDLRLRLYQMAGVDLTRINGISVLTAQKVLTETGVDMSAWPTSKHFASWLSLCPHNDKTGGKIIRSKTKKSQNRAAAALRIATTSLLHSKSALGGYYRSMRARLGKPEAVTATAHKLARIIYAMLKNQTEYQDPGEGYYEGQARQRAINNLKRKAKKLGFELVSNQA